MERNVNLAKSVKPTIKALGLWISSSLHIPTPFFPTVETQLRLGVLSGEVAGELITTWDAEKEGKELGEGKLDSQSPLFLSVFQLPFSLALTLPDTRNQPQLLFCTGARTMAASKPLAPLLSGCLPTESVGSVSKTRLLRQGRDEASPALKFHSVCFFCSIDWKDYDDREPRHKGQSEVLEGLLQQVRALHQHYSCRGKDKNLRWAIG